MRLVSLLRKRVLPVMALAALVAPTAHAATATDTVALCAPDAGGTLRVLVVMPPGQWPAGGFDVRRGSTSVGHIGPDASALAALEPGAAQALQALPARARAAPPDAAGAVSIIYGRLLSDWDFARAAGVAASLAGVRAGSVKFVVMPLGATGQPTGRPIACRMASAAPPAAPRNLEARAHRQGISLAWQPVAGKPVVPVLSFRVWRSDGGEAVALIEHAPFLPTQRKPGDTAYIDSLAPLEKTLIYEVAQVDALGRMGPRARVTLYAPDSAAVKPPDGLAVKSAGQAVELQWTGSDNPHTTGYVVERAFMSTGPFELMTPKALARDATAWRDSGLTSGTQYYYRVRAMGPRGDLGPPSDAVAAQSRAQHTPAAPADVKAMIGNTRVRLEWALAPAEVAGYIVERRADSSPVWSRLNQELLMPNRYDDALGPQVGGTLYYRVTAVSHDNQRSEPSAVVEVRLEDTVPPLPPRIVVASGVDGRVRLEVRAAQPVADTARIFVLRGGTAQAPGLVIGEPLNGTASQYEDAWVEPGKTYWYHLVAYDAAGNRSNDSEAVAVRVGAPPMPAPPVPTVRRQSSPMPRVVLAFAAPPGRLMVVVERSKDGAHWRQIAGPTTDAQAQDLDPPSGQASYRLRYQSADGSIGPASVAVAAAGGGGESVR